MTQVTSGAVPPRQHPLRHTRRHLQRNGRRHGAGGGARQPPRHLPRQRRRSPRALPALRLPPYLPPRAAHRRARRGRRGQVPLPPRQRRPPAGDAAASAAVRHQRGAGLHPRLHPLHPTTPGLRCCPPVLPFARRPRQREASTRSHTPTALLCASAWRAGGWLQRSSSGGSTWPSLQRSMGAPRVVGCTTRRRGHLLALITHETPRYNYGTNVKAIWKHAVWSPKWRLSAPSAVRRPDRRL